MAVPKDDQIKITLTNGSAKLILDALYESERQTDATMELIEVLEDLLR